MMKPQQFLITLGLVATTFLTGCADTNTRPYSSSPGHPSSSPAGHASGSPAGHASGSTPGHPSSPSSYATYGVIEEIDSIRDNAGIAGTGIGVGAVIGGVVGGVVGNQVGGGRGKTAATVVGAAGGAIAGNEIQKRNNANRGGDTYRLRVRLDRGGYVTVTQRDIADLRVGDQVRIQNDTVYRN